MGDIHPAINTVAAETALPFDEWLAELNSELKTLGTHEIDPALGRRSYRSDVAPKLFAEKIYADRRQRTALGWLLSLGNLAALTVLAIIQPVVAIYFAAAVSAYDIGCAIFLLGAAVYAIGWIGMTSMKPVAANHLMSGILEVIEVALILFAVSRIEQLAGLLKTSADFALTTQAAFALFYIGIGILILMYKVFSFMERKLEG